MDLREKLIEMSKQLRYCADVSDCANCKRWDEVYENQCVDNLLLMAADLIDEVAHGVTVQEWISVTERLPTEEAKAYEKEYGDYPECIVMIDRGYVPTTLYYDWENDEWFKYNTCLKREKYKVTHWMPLPSTEGRII